jgi:hypothetical protein
MPTNHSLQTTMPRYMFIAAGASSARDGTPAQSDERQRIQDAAAALNGWVERVASPFGEGMIYTICQLPSNGAAASLATVMRAVYTTEVRTVALPRSREIYDRA